ncbi:mechanosensitive ion channel family protein [Achromobacter kerstersii]|uniref:mechanosensitive ion channel family protein n=1 Tax=Achromobacter kerstersii TaxID=1353890 RepID=UPI001581DBFB|nr:mechanosensitive ion channel family protein [Achromobacter kerstersii]
MNLSTYRAKMASAVLSVCIVLFVPFAVASSSPVDVTNQLTPVNRASPSETYQSLIAGSERLEDAYTRYKTDKSFARLREVRYQFDRLRGLLDLSAVPSANRVKVGNAALTYLADILARLPPVDLTSVPGASASDKALPARWTIPGTDIQMARVEDGPNTGDYLITGESISNLAGYYDRVRTLPLQIPRQYVSFHKEHISATGPLIPGWITDRVPEALKVAYLDTPVWKIIAIAFVGLVMLGLSYGWTAIARSRGGQAGELRRLAWRLTIPVALLAIYFVTDWYVIAHINPAGHFATGESLLATAAFYTLVAWAVWIGCFLLAETAINAPRRAGNSLDAHLLRLSARIAAIGSVGGILVYGANEIGIPAYGLIAGIGVGGFALALAAQSTIENLIGGVALFVDRPFRIGDTIQFGDQRGSVEMVGTRSSRIRALDGTLITVPNSDLAKMKIVNFSARDKCLFVHTLALDVTSPTRQIRVLLPRLHSLIASHDLVEKSEGWPRVRCTGVAIGRLEVELRAYVSTAHYTQFLATQESLLLQVLGAVEEMEIKLAPAVVAATYESE